MTHSIGSYDGSKKTFFFYFIKIQLKTQKSFVSLSYAHYFKKALYVTTSIELITDNQ